MLIVGQNFIIETNFKDHLKISMGCKKVTRYRYLLKHKRIRAKKFMDPEGPKNFKTGGSGTLFLDFRL
jgi:hypothetical protein